MGFLNEKRDEKKKIIKVTSEMDLDKILQTVEDSTTLLLEDGTYHGKFRLVRKYGITIKGKSTSHDVIIKSSKGITLSLKDCKNCILENIALQSKDTEIFPLLLSHVENIQLRNIFISHSPKAMKIDAKSLAIKIYKSEFAGNITIEDSKDITMRSNKIHATNSQIALKFLNHIQLFLNKNSITGMTGMLLKNVSSEKNYMSSISDNKITGTLKNAIILDNCSSFSLTSNNFQGASDSSVSILKSKNIYLGKLGVKNRIKAIQGYGVIVSGCEECSLKDNWIVNQDSKLSALSISSSQNIECIKNKITGFSFYKEGTIKEIKGGVTVKRTKNILLKNNQITKGSLEGISIEDNSTTEIINNIIRENWGNGIRIDTSEGKIQQNQIVKNMHGINVRNSKGSIKGNTISQNKKDGIFLEASSPEVINNVLKQNNNGISLERNSIPKIQQNTFIQNKSYGISFLQPVFIDCEKDNIFKEQEKKISR